MTKILDLFPCRAGSFLPVKKVQAQIEAAIAAGTSQVYFAPGQVAQADFRALEVMYRGRGWALSWEFDAHESLDILVLSEVT